MKKVIVVILVMMFLVVGCATTGGWFNDENTNARILTKGIVSEYLAHNPGSLDAIYQASTDALTYVKGDAVTLDSLYSGILTAIKPSIDKLTPDGQAAMFLLVSELKDRLIKQMAANQITDTSKVIIQVSTMIEWVHDVAATRKSIMGGA